MTSFWFHLVLSRSKHLGMLGYQNKGRCLFHLHPHLPFSNPAPCPCPPPQEELACIETDHAVISLGATLTDFVAGTCVLIQGNWGFLIVLAGGALISWLAFILKSIPQLTWILLSEKSSLLDRGSAAIWFCQTSLGKQKRGQWALFASVNCQFIRRMKRDLLDSWLF